MATVDETVRLLAATEVFGDLDPDELGRWPRCPCHATGTAAR